MYEASIFTLVILAVVLARLTYSIAEDKGHDGVSWAFVGFFLGPFGLIAAAGLSDRVQRKYLRQIAENFGELKENK
tara:strand:- start:403 stop:630 length:228 start_codon:yes stop_codon:yes gene_type:complete